jgi:cellulose biosynthesis protein BcsQ
MIIAVNSPRHGLGQTVTAINLSAMLSEQTGAKVLIVDTNRHSRDMDYYLSRTNITKGMDEFCSLSSSGLLNSKSFKSCINRAENKIHFISPNEMQEAGSIEWKSLLNYAETEYSFCVLDLSQNIGLMDEIILDAADIVLLVASDGQYIIERITQGKDYRKIEDKLLITVNRIITRYDNQKVLYNFESATKELRTSGLNCPVFPLSYDIGLKNECDTNSLLNYIKSRNYSKNLYFRQLAELSTYILTMKGLTPIKNVVPPVGIVRLLKKLWSEKGGEQDAFSE